MGAPHIYDESTLTDIYRYLLDETASICITDISGKITYINSNYEELSGFKMQELLGYTHDLLLAEIHGDEFIKNIWDTILKGTTWKGEIKYKAKDGSYFWVEAMIVPLLDDFNRIESFLSVNFDISTKKDAEELLKFFIDESYRTRGQKFFNQMMIKLCGFLNFDYGLVGEYFKDSKTVTTHTFFADGAIQNNISYPVPAAPCEIVLHNKKSVSVLEKVQEAYPDDQDLVVLKAESYIGFPMIDEEGKSIGLIVFINKSPIDQVKVNQTHQIVDHVYHFITQEMLKQKSNTQLEYQKRMIEEMEKLSSMGTLAAFLGHEINNSLQIISGNVSRIKKHLKEVEEVPEKVSNSLESIKKVSTNLSLIVKGIKTLAHSGEKQIHEKLFFHDIVGENRALIDLKNKETGAEILVDIPEDIQIMGNRTQLGQVIVNLFTNSLDAIQNFDEKWAKIECSKKGDKVFINFIDCGTGIEDNILEHIFDEFFTTKAVGKGTGLGLSVVKKIAMEHQGDFYYDGKKKNTCFTLVLPLVKE